MLNWQRRHIPACSPMAGTKPVRVGCVNYLNARPLWHGLGKRPDLFSLKYAVPAKVSTWLHNGEVDLALVSSIEYETPLPCRTRSRRYLDWTGRLGRRLLPASR